ncbi:hybrid sensor histidine kinase/response regulator [Bryobacter aggregatus]|uniref:hybrid sensor histidine kinase/response regulator n=1 Tax=Bryobacter aggregatus TaxID=360054 RepID=UPI00138E3D40|nr:ATP-binding protein [Bryobacter aggregatus]
MKYVISILLFSASTLSCQFPGRPIGARKVLRMGSNQSPPFNYWDEKGQPAGFAVDVINRAAEIAGYRLEWIHSDLSPDDTLAQKKADFWPFVTVYEERRDDFYMTDAWWRTATILFFPKQLQIKSAADLANRSIALTSPSKQFVPKLQLPASTTVRIQGTSEETFLAMCQGKVDAAWLDYRVADGVLLNRPEACPSMQLGSLLLEDTARTFSIGARFGFENEAKRLRAAIDEMGDSGEIVTIATNWKLLHKTDSAFILWLNRTQEKNTHLRVLSGAILVVLGIAIFFLQRMSQARKNAELSARARSQFLANMSHEIRTPMNGILGMMELTLDSELSREQRENLSMARHSARALLEILDDILDFSRIESGKLSLESIPFDLREVAKRSVQILSLAAHEKGLHLEVLADEKLPAWLAGDPGRLQQVLVNLLGNAVKFTAMGKVLLRLEAEPQENGYWKIAIAVIDSGVGIPVEQQNRIFDAFTQADSSTTRRFGGTGLGLAISTQLVKMMGGKLEVHSKLGEGSTFSFEIQLHEAQAAVPTPTGSRLSPSRPLSLLVAEDNDVNRTLLHRILQRAGHEVETVTNGLQALEALQNRSFDVVLMDIHMPEMDGLEATRAVRAREKACGKHTPIVALTALALKGDAERCLAAGMDAYLPKPLNRSDLFALLAKIEAGADVKVPSPS